MVVGCPYYIRGMDKIEKTDEEWRQLLTPEQFYVLREKGTEPAFSSEMEFNTEDGTYHCAGCGTQLFRSDQKFDAHCGWPSFFDAETGKVEFHRDTSHGMERVEVTCAACGGHLGHVFEGEGFKTPTDQRYCINSLSLKFNPVEK